MEKDFESIVRSKTKDELVRIVIHKEEYKDELVDAATAELKRREKENVSDAVDDIQQVHHFQQAVPTVKEQETPFGIFLAGILLFLTGPAWLFLGVLQAAGSAITDDTDVGIISIWNILFAVLSVVVGIGILKGYRWGYEWGMGTAIINVLWFGYEYFTGESMLVLFLMIIEFIILISLATNRGYFNPIVILPDSIKLKAPGHYTNAKDYQQTLRHLHTLIQENKKSIFGASDAAAIRTLISELGATKDSAEYLLTSYKQVAGTDLIEDLKKLTNNYNGIKEYCMTFINHGLVSRDYPHERCK